MDLVEFKDGKGMIIVCRSVKVNEIIKNIKLLDFGSIVIEMDVILNFSYSRL